MAVGQVISSKAHFFVVNAAVLALPVDAFFIGHSFRFPHENKFVTQRRIEALEREVGGYRVAIEFVLPADGLAFRRTAHQRDAVLALRFRFKVKIAQVQFTGDFIEFEGYGHGAVFLFPQAYQFF